MKRLMAMTVATVIATSGCSYLNAWRCGYTGDDGCCEMYGEGGYMDGGYMEGQYPVYAPGGEIVGPEMYIPGETIPAPSGEPLPGPAPQ